MSTNLEKKSFERDIHKLNKNMECSIDVIEQKFNDAIKRIDNMKKSFEDSIIESDIETKGPEILQKIENKKQLIDQIGNFFLNSNTNVDDLTTLVNKYSNNKFKLANLASNDVISGDPLFTDTGTEIHGDKYNTSLKVTNDSFLTLTGVNKIEEGELGFAKGYINTTGHNRSLYLNIFDSINITFVEDLLSQQPFVKESNPIRSLDNKPNQSVPFVVIERINKVHSFDFGIQYTTKDITAKCYIKNISNEIEIIETASQINSSAFVKRYYGSLILEDCGNEIKSSYILNNGDPSLFEGDNPEYTFRISFDEQFIYLFLENVKPCRLLYSEVENINETSGIYDTDGSLSQIFIRDILELMINEDHQTINEDDILSIKNKYGFSKELFGNNVSEIIKDLLGILNPFRDNMENIQNVFLIPNYMVNLSLKDNSFHVKDTFIVGQMYDNNEILELPYNLLHIIPKTSTMIQLEGIPFTDGNNIEIINPDKKSNFTSVNTIFSIEKNSFVKRCSVYDLIKENSNFIIDHLIDNQPVFYQSTALITTKLNDNNMVDTNKIPDYVIDEIGKCVKSGDEFLFYCTYYITCTKTNEIININNDKELRDFITKTPISFEYFINFDNETPIYEESLTKLSLKGTNFGTSPHKNIFPVLYNPLYGLNLNDTFKGLVRINTKILPDVYDYNNIIINHITLADDKFKYGEVPKKYPNSDSVPNQAMILSTNLNYKTITLTGYENCSIDNPTTLYTVVGSTITYTIKPLNIYKINRILVNDEEVSLINDKLYLRNITEDINVIIETSLRDLMRTISVTVSENCLNIIPSNNVIIEEGESITFTIIPDDGYNLTSVIANGEEVTIIYNTFTLRNVMVDTNLEIFCTEIPKNEYLFKLDSVENCTTNIESGEHPVLEDDFYEVIITPNENYQIVKFIINGNEYTINGEIIEESIEIITNISFLGNKVQFNGIKENIVFQVIVETIPIPIHYIKVNIENGEISPVNTTIQGIPVEENDDIVFTITPNDNYFLDIIEINGIIIDEENQFEGIIIENNTITFNSVQDDALLNITCSQIPLPKYLVTIDIPIDANFTIHNDQGTIDNLEYEENSTPIFTIIPNEGYYITHVILNSDVIFVDSNVFQLPPIIENTTISAIVEELPINSYSITISRMFGCDIDIYPDTIVTEGDNVTITIIPDEGYDVEVVKINGIIQNLDNLIIEITSIDKNYDISVSCKPRYLLIQPIHGNNYNITPGIATPVKYGGYQVFKIHPDEGYEVESVIINTDGIDSDPIPSGKYYLFNNVSVPHSIRAIVYRKTFSVTPLSGEGYSINPSTPEIVFYGENSQEYSFIPETDKYIYKIFVDNDEVYHNMNTMFEPNENDDLSYLTIKHTIENIHKNTIVYAETKEFSERSYSVTVVCNELHCIVSPASFITIGKGGNVTISVTTIEGYRITQVRVNGIQRDLFGNDYEYYEVFNNITTDIYISVLSDIRPPITYNVIHGPNSYCTTICLNPNTELNPLGSTSNPVEVYKGNSLTFKATPINYLYKIKQFIINDLDIYPMDGETGEKTFELLDIQDNMRIAAIAELIRHRITLIEVENCSVEGFDGEGSFILVNHNINITLNFIPNADHELDILKVNDIEVSAIGNSYVLTQVIEDKDIVVKYIPKLYVTVHDGLHCKYNVYLSGNILELDAISGVWRISRGTNYFKITVVPDEGYEVDRSWISAPEVTQPNTGVIKYEEVLTNPEEVIFNDIQTNIGFYSECKKKIYNIFIVQPSNGEITYNEDLVSSVQVEHGDNITFEILPNNGYKISELRINGSVESFPTSLTEQGGTYTFTDITNNKSITVTTVLDE